MGCDLMGQNINGAVKLDGSSCDVPRHPFKFDEGTLDTVMIDIILPAPALGTEVNWVIGHSDPLKPAPRGDRHHAVSPPIG